MTASTWHAADEDLRRYASGEAGPVVQASLDAHVLRCATCQSRLAILAGAGETARRWERLADAIDVPSRSFLRPGNLGRMALAAPSLRWAWLAALTAVVALPVLAGMLLETRSGALALQLALAPLVPVGAVALAYRDVADPAGEITLATPSAGLRLVAMRAFVVSVAAVPAGLLASTLVGIPLHLAAAGLLPGLALAAVVLLAGTTRVDPVLVAATLGGLWAVAVGAPSPLRGIAVARLAEALSSPAVQLTAVCVVAAALLLTLTRRDAVAYRRTA
ncbi:MAG TPA: hypothetical protein VFX33_16460 [Actinomycetales bacterium]|nr:hypothetical protein [Actinomycetales bacterium]